MTQSRNYRVAYPRRHRPTVITLPVANNVEASGLPPVRIFVGTEPAQFRAERAFMWSVEKHRDPARVYEIALMKQLSGFDDRRWLTGFTNYRFAIPYFAGGRGRAIYNDIDQVYCDDPAKLFDLDVTGHGYLAVSPRDTSVMLLDCAAMRGIWTLQRAQHWRKNRLLDLAIADSALYGELGGEWNARDNEHRDGWSKCVHFTTIHKQPWRPFPDRFVYQPNPVEDIFLQQEQEANAVGYNVYSAARPSADFAIWSSAQAEKLAPANALQPLVRKSLVEFVSKSNGSSVLLIGDGGAEPRVVGSGRGQEIKEIAQGLGHSLGQPSASAEGFDGVVCTADLASLPVDDLPWVLDEIVGRAKSFVLIATAQPSRSRATLRHQGTVYRADWWSALLQAASARRPQIHWTLMLAPDGDFDGDIVYRQGGAFLGEKPPSVWVLEDHKPGHTTQSLGLAEALGWPYERIKLQFGPLAQRQNFLRGPTLRGLSGESASRLVAPWPDLVVATGARSAPIAEWIRRESNGKTRTVQLGRKGAHLGNEFDLAVAPAYVGLYPDPRRIETTLPLTRVRGSELAAAAERWRPILGQGKSPRIALLVGGDDSVHALDPEQASRMGGEVANLARDAGGSVFVTTSRRTDPNAAQALVAALGNVTVHSYHWSAAHHEDENPYLGYLALADILVVSGESASMLAEASATGKPVFIYPLQKRGKDTHRVKFLIGQGVSEWVMRRAFARPLNRRGHERPQAGLELLCARLAAGGWVRPHGDITKLHRALIERGTARYFDGALPDTVAEPVDEAAQVAERVRSLIGFKQRDSSI